MKNVAFSAVKVMDIFQHEWKGRIATVREIASALAHEYWGDDPSDVDPDDVQEADVAVVQEVLDELVESQSLRSASGHRALLLSEYEDYHNSAFDSHQVYYAL